MAIQTLTARHLLAVLAMTTLAVAGCAVDSVPESGDTTPSPSPDPEPDVLDVWPEQHRLVDIFPDFPDQAFVLGESLSESAGTYMFSRYAGLSTVTADEFEEVVEFFLSSLPASGWTLTSHRSQGTTDDETYMRHLEFDGHGVTGVASMSVWPETGSRQALSMFMRLQEAVDQPWDNIRYVPLPRWWDEAVPPAPDGWLRGSVGLSYGGRSVPADASEVDTDITLSVRYSEDQVLEDGDEWDRTTDQADALLEAAAEHYRSALPEHGWTLVSDEDASDEDDDGWGNRRQELLFSGYRTNLTLRVHYPYGPELGPTNWVNVDLTFEAGG